LQSRFVAFKSSRVRWTRRVSFSFLRRRSSSIIEKGRSRPFLSPRGLSFASVDASCLVYRALTSATIGLRRARPRREISRPMIIRRAIEGEMLLSCFLSVAQRGFSRRAGVAFRGEERPTQIYSGEKARRMREVIDDYVQDANGDQEEQLSLRNNP